MASTKYSTGNPTRRHSRLTRRQFIAHTSKVGLSASLLPLSAEAAAASNEIKLGAVYPLSGNFANVAVEFRNAAVMALDFINGINDITGEVPFASDLPLAQGRGIPRLNGAKLRLIFADSQGKPELALSDADRLITADKCVGLFGCYTSATTITASEVAERYGIPFINPDSSSPRLTRRGFKWFVRIQPDDATFSKDFFVFLKSSKQSARTSRPRGSPCYTKTPLLGRTPRKRNWSTRSSTGTKS